MRNTAFSEPIRCITSLENADESPATPHTRALDKLSSQSCNVVRLECEPAERIARKRVESCGNQHDVWVEANRGRLDSSPQRIHVLLGRQCGRHWNIPYILVQSSVIGRSGARVPRPLVHRHEMNCRIVFDERLCSVSVMDIPVDDQHSIQPVNRLRVTRRDCDVAQQAESHRSRLERVMARRTNCAKRSRPGVNRAVNRRECATGTRSCCVPGAFARDSVGIELAASRGSDLLKDCDILRIVHERNLFHAGVSPFELLDRLEERGNVSQRARYCSQPADMFRMAPTSVVPSAVAVGNESDR